MSPSFHVAQPSHRSTSVIFASPHSGRDYSWGFQRRSILDTLTLRSSEDAFVDELFAGVTGFGAPLLTLSVPRAFVDVNRGAEELDPALIKGIEKTGHNPRVSSGLGVIPRVVAGGRAIYRGKLTLAEVQARLDAHWHPYHRRLATLIEESHVLFGQAILIDCHSMPHEAIDSLCRGDRSRVQGRGAEGRAQHALCGRLYRPDLWPPLARSTCGAGRDRPGALHERAQPQAQQQLRPDEGPA